MKLELHLKLQESSDFFLGNPHTILLSCNGGIKTRSSRQMFRPVTLPTFFQIRFNYETKVISDKYITYSFGRPPGYLTRLFLSSVSADTHVSRNTCSRLQRSPPHTRSFLQSFLQSFSSSLWSLLFHDGKLTHGGYTVRIFKVVYVTENVSTPLPPLLFQSLNRFK